VLLVALVGLAARLLAFVSTYAVNVLSSDEWDFSAVLFRHGSLWEQFRWQHSIQRQGLGNLLAAAVFALTGWDTRIEAFAIALLLVLAALLALVLKWRVSRRLSLADAVIPALCLTVAQFEILVGTLDLAYAALPLVLLLSTALAWTVRRWPLRIGLVLVLGFCAIHTGYGLFIGALTPLLFTFDALDARLPVAERRASAVATVASLASLASFFVGYNYEAVRDALATPAPLAARLAFLGQLGAPEVWLGLLVFAGGFAALAVAAFRQVRHRGKTLDRVVLVLLGYSLLFALHAAVGRASLGPSAANAPRYVTHLFGLFFALYLLASTVPTPRVRAAVLITFAVLVGWRELHQERAFTDAGIVAARKAAWKRCMLDGNRLAVCDRRTRPTHPNPVAADIEGKLRYLAEHHLNLFNGHFGGSFDHPTRTALLYPPLAAPDE
jgi:hypothetical protein